MCFSLGVGWLCGAVTKYFCKYFKNVWDGLRIFDVIFEKFLTVISQLRTYMLQPTMSSKFFLTTGLHQVRNLLFVINTLSFNYSKSISLVVYSYVLFKHLSITPTNYIKEANLLIFFILIEFLNFFFHVL